MSLVLRHARPSDAAACGSICHAAFKSIAGRHAFPPDFPSVDVATGLATALLARPDVFAGVVERDGRVLGSNYLWEGSVIAGSGRSRSTRRRRTRVSVAV